MSLLLVDGLRHRGTGSIATPLGVARDEVIAVASGQWLYRRERSTRNREWHAPWL
jgi:hypothetical protein